MDAGSAPSARSQPARCCLRATCSHIARQSARIVTRIANCSQIANTSARQTTTVSFMTATKMPRRRTATAIRFPEELHDELVRAAEERDFSVNYLVVKAVQDFLPRLVPAEELSLTR